MSATRKQVRNARPIGMTPPSGVTNMPAAHQLIATEMRSPDFRHLAPIAIQRWEAEGGALGVKPHA